MHYKAFPTALVLILLSFNPFKAEAVRKGNSEIFIGTGIVTSEEFYGVTSTSKMDIPYSYSGAWFFSYRYFITDYISFGLSAGIDNVKGDLTYGFYEFDRYGRYGTTGNYVHSTYTIAPEILFKYYGKHQFMMYGTLGVGYTFSTIEKSYYPEYYTNSFQNGISELGPTNPDITHQNHYNMQVTPLGFRAGGKIAYYIEFGYGYKGLVSTGISLKL